MNLSLRWLKEFVDIGDISPRDFSEAMTMSGSKVELYEEEGGKIDNIVVGKILSVEKHPDADKLVVCRVNVGEKEVQIVTAATNVKVDDLVPVCLDKSHLYDGTQIKKGKLRGVVSEGMFCSVAELGITVHDFPYAIQDGIFILQDDPDLHVTPGMNIKDAIGLNDICVEFEITSNRPDCFSVIGLAREAAATFDKELKLHTPSVKGSSKSSDGMLSVKVAAPDLCPVYSARIVENVRVKPSPLWLRERLRAMGVRPINNIVDITNYVMLEYGQPMHAFDLRFIKDGKINVRLAQNGEKITTLDGVDRTLNDTNLVIADAEKPVAIAGVMGGEYSGIMDDTTTIVFESANFSGSSVRLTAKSQNMRTDASSRYEKGLDPNACLPALERACELVELLDAGDVLDGVIVDDNSSIEPLKIKLNADWVNHFLNTDLSFDEMKAILEKIDCKFDGDDIIIPTFRPDLLHKADIAEEIARFHGYNTIESTPLSGGAQGKFSTRQKFDKNITNTLIALGFDEIMTYSFISPKYYNKVMMPENHKLRNSVVISNPLGEDTSIMRTIALPSMLEILSKNYNNRNEYAYLFEIAREYRPTTPDKLPDEKNVLTVGMYGGGVDFFKAKGAAVELMNRLGVQNYEFVAADDVFAYHPGRCAKILVDGDFVGVLGEIHPTVQSNYGIGTRVYAFSLNTDMLFEKAQLEKHYTPLPKFPAISRDLAVVCSKFTPVAVLEKAIREGAGKYLESLKLFDVYEGKQIAAGLKSAAFSLTLRSSDGTLTDEQANSAVNKAIKALEKVGAELRR
ncbi:MAG: phenylalanine--tRNA ligase subunit beta [Clostridia bacterium]|nr:phenylalanine--tRNA ligase subunit beta [Clostridia bacterium]